MGFVVLKERHVPVVPCMCERCHTAILEAYGDVEGARRWEQRVRIALRLRRTLRQRLVDARLDECDLAEARREKRERREAIARAAARVREEQRAAGELVPVVESVASLRLA